MFKKKRPIFRVSPVRIDNSSLIQNVNYTRTEWGVQQYMPGYWSTLGTYKDKQEAEEVLNYMNNQGK